MNGAGNKCIGTKSQLTAKPALWIICFLMLVATILIAVFQDKLVDVGPFYLMNCFTALIP
jgi:hypothetical protein